MMKSKKKILSGICLLTAAVLAAGCAGQPFPETDITAEKLTDKNICQNQQIISDEFAVLTVSKEDGIKADGYSAGNSAFGFTLKDDGSITVNVDGSEMTFDEAAEKTGCTLTENADGSMVIQSPFQKSQVIVKAEKEFDTYGAESSEEMIKNHFLLTYSSPSAAYSAYRLLSEDENVEYAEANAVLKASGTEEPDNAENWGLEKTGISEFAEILSEKNSNLPEINVAVIDSGVYYEHSMLKGRILDGGRNFSPGYPFSKRNTAEDDRGHGTHIAGVICSATNDNVKILPVKVLNHNGYGDTYDIYCGMMYAVDCGADIISMSIGAYGKSNLFSEAVHRACDSGITVCVSAGNDGLGCTDSYSSISGIEECVVVSSVNSHLEPSEYSNYQNIDFAAPGENIVSASLDGPDELEEMSGTSMAVPFAAACFANVLSADNTLSSEEAYEIIRANAADLCDPGYDELTGWGMINMKNFRMDAEPSVNPSLPPSLPSDVPQQSGGSSESEKMVIRNGVLEYFDTSGMTSVNLAEMVEQKAVPEFYRIGSEAFQGSLIEEIILPDSVTSIADNAFSSCSRLRKAVTKAVEIGRRSFAESAVEEVTFSDRLTYFPDEAFSDCRNLKKISAPSLVSVGKYALALQKQGLSEENAVETDIDFSKVKYADECAFEGYVFPGPVSFGIESFLDLRAFNGAYGESASFPLVKFADSIQFVSYIYFSEMRFDSAESVSLTMVCFSGALGLGECVRNLNFDPYYFGDIWIYTINDSPETEEFISSLGYTCHSSSELFLSDMTGDTVTSFTPYEITAVLPGENLSYSFRLTDESGTTVMSEENSDMPVKFTAVKEGEYIFCLEIKDSSGNSVFREEKNIYVTGRDNIYKTDMNSAAVINADDIYNEYYSEDDYYGYVFSFTPETDGEYRIYSSGWRTDVFCPDGSVVYGSSEVQISPEGGKTYYAGLRCDRECYFSVYSTDTVLKSLTETIENGSICIFKNADSSRCVHIVSSDGTVLTEGKDFYAEYSESVYPDIEYYTEERYAVLIYGTGEYYGMYSDNVVFAPVIGTDERISGHCIADFIPEKSGTYSIVFFPDLNAAVERGITGSLIIKPSVAAVDKAGPGESENPQEAEIKYTCSSEVSVFLEKGVRYRVTYKTDDGNPADIIITDKPTAGQCEAEYRPVYQYTGEPTVPEIRLTHEGKLLEEGRDYIVTVWRNNDQGLMFVTADGCGTYSGSRRFVMITEGEEGKLKTGKFGDMDVIDIKPNEEFEYFGGIPYRITLDRDTVVSVADRTRYFLYEQYEEISFISADSGSPEIFTGANNLFLKKGSYFLEPKFYDSSRNAGYTEKLIVITEDDLISVESCELAVKFDSEGLLQYTLIYNDEVLEEGTDYKYDENTFGFSGGRIIELNGTGRFTGRLTFSNISLPEVTGTGVLKSDISNPVKLDAPLRNEWIPENERYILESSSYINTDVIITDGDGVLVWKGKVSSRNTPEINVEAGKKHYVYISGGFCETVDFSFRTEGRLSDCSAEYSQLVPLNSISGTPEVVFRDGDYVLEEGKDYIFVSDGFTNAPGRSDYLFRGCGKYFGDFSLPVTAYPETITDFKNYAEAEIKKEYEFPIFYFSGNDFENNVIRLKLTSSFDEKTCFSTNLFAKDEECREYISLFMYDSDGRFIGAGDDVRNFSLEKGQSVYVIMIPPYGIDYDAQQKAYSCSLSFSAGRYGRTENKDDAVCPGDVNCDGTVNTADFICLRDWITGRYEPSSEQGKLNGLLAGGDNRTAPDSRDLLALVKMMNV